jgi:glycosyltransferase involved in cell wall biosynthesis
MGYLRSPAAQRAAFAVEDLAYRGASVITTVSPGLVDLLSSKPSAAGRVRLLPNGVDVERFGSDLTPAAARRVLGWPERFTIVYTGTVGLAQGIGTLIEAAALIKDPVAIRVVGEGVEKPAIEARARELGTAGLTFHPAVPQREVSSIIAAADAGLVILKAGPLFEQSLPTKLLETMAAGRPVIVGADGLAADIVRSADAGYVARAEDPADLARAIERARDDDQDRARRGAAARVAVAADYGRMAILDRLASILREAARP